LRYLIAGVLYTAVYLGLGVLLGGHPLARTAVANTLLFALAAGVCLIVVRRRREWEGAQRLFWDAFALGLALWCVGQIGFTFNTLVEQRSWIQWHTMFSLCGGIGPTVALLTFPHRGPRKASVGGIGIEITSYAMLMGFIYAYFIMVPSVVTAGPSPQRTLLVLVQLQRLILFLGFSWALWAAWDTPWRGTYARLTAGAAIGFFLRLAASGAISRDSYQEGSIYDLAWIVPYLCYAWAVLAAPPTPLDPEQIPPRPGWQSGLVSALPLLLTPTIGFGLLRVQPIGEPGDSIRLLLTTLATVAGLGLLTLRLSLQTGELQRADARLRLLAAATEQTADLILITRGNAEFEHANEACVQALGYTREELARMKLPDLLERGFERMVDHIGREVRQTGIWRGTLIHRRKDGSTFPASSTVVALRNREGRVTHFVGVQRDITEELKLRDQLVHSERLSAVGELIAGVAHEINNPLQTIIGLVELMIEERRATGQERDLEVVRQEAARAGQIVRNLLSFTRRSSPDRIAADLNEIARAAARLREHHLAQQNIALDLDLHPGVLPVLVNQEEIQQVALNLILNAEHAIGDTSGRIAVRTNAGEHAHTIDVIDDGPGISAELQGRVFEPFFTTKDVGQGTGLGLSIALGIATAHGGSLELCPETRHPRPATRPGACFRLTLPAHAVVMPCEVLRPAGERHAGGRKHALIIEDEPPIRALLGRMVARRDYQITEAASCAEARAAGGRATFDLVLCDVRLPDGNGMDCLRYFREAQPALGRRFVFVTGDIGAVPNNEHELAGMRVLAKPFTARDLDRVLGEVEIGV